MLGLLSDENFNGEIVRGLFRAQPELDLVRVQDVGLLSADDFRLGCSGPVRNLSGSQKSHCVAV